MRKQIIFASVLFLYVIFSSIQDSQGLTKTIDCDNYVVSYDSTIVILTCEHYEIGGTLYTSPYNSLSIKTNGVSGIVEMDMPKALMSKVYKIYAHESSSYVKFEETDSEHNVRIKFEVPTGIWAISIEGDEGYEIPTSLNYILFAILIIGAGIGSMVFLVLRKPKPKVE